MTRKLWKGIASAAGVALALAVFVPTPVAMAEHGASAAEDVPLSALGAGPDAGCASTVGSSVCSVGEVAVCWIECFGGYCYLYWGGFPTGEDCFTSPDCEYALT